MLFNTCYSDVVKRSVSGKCHVELAKVKNGRWRIYCTTLRRLSLSLSECHSKNAALVGNCHLHSFKRTIGFEEHTPILRIRIFLLQPVTSIAVTDYYLFAVLLQEFYDRVQAPLEFKYFGTTLTDQNFIQEEIKSRMKPGKACYHSVQNLLFSSLLSKNLKIKIYRTVILSVVLYGYETWSLTLREERRLRVFENRVLRRIFGPKKDEVTGE